MYAAPRNNKTKNKSAIVSGNLQPKKRNQCPKPINNRFSLNTLYSLSYTLSHRLYSRRLATLFIITHISTIKYKTLKNPGKFVQTAR